MPLPIDKLAALLLFTTCVAGLLGVGYALGERWPLRSRTGRWALWGTAVAMPLAWSIVPPLVANLLSPPLAAFLIALTGAMWRLPLWWMVGTFFIIGPCVTITTTQTAGELVTWELNNGTTFHGWIINAGVLLVSGVVGKWLFTVATFAARHTPTRLNRPEA